MADFAFWGLSDIAQRLMRKTEGEDIGDTAAHALTHAYLFIDATNRLREIVRSMPGLKYNREYELFIRGTAGVEDLRNVVQHLNREIQNIAKRRTASMGTLTWLGPSPSATTPATSWE